MDKTNLMESQKGEKKEPLCYITAVWLRALEWTQYEPLSVLT